jgi:hypothetical protein
MGDTDHKSISNSVLNRSGGNKMNRKDKTHNDETRVEFSLDFDPNGKFDAEFSGKLSPRTRQMLRQLRRWLLPSVGSALVTVLTTVVFNTPTPVPRPMQPHSVPGVEMPTGVNQNR